MKAYYQLKWSIAGKSAVVGAVASLVLLPLSWYASLALMLGVAFGLFNALAVMRGSERLADTGVAASFGISSLLRLGAFSIVAAALAARGPWWALGPFLAGFFLPLAAYAWGASRAFRQRSSSDR